MEEILQLFDHISLLSKGTNYSIKGDKNIIFEDRVNNELLIKSTFDKGYAEGALTFCEVASASSFNLFYHQYSFELFFYLK